MPRQLLREHASACFTESWHTLFLQLTVCCPFRLLLFHGRDWRAPVSVVPSGVIAALIGGRSTCTSHRVVSWLCTWWGRGQALFRARLTAPSCSKVRCRRGRGDPLDVAASSCLGLDIQLAACLVMLGIVIDTAPANTSVPVREPLKGLWPPWTLASSCTIIGLSRCAWDRHRCRSGQGQQTRLFQ